MPYYVDFINPTEGIGNPACGEGVQAEAARGLRLSGMDVGGVKRGWG